MEPIGVLGTSLFPREPGVNSFGNEFCQGRSGKVVRRKSQNAGNDQFLQVSMLPSAAEFAQMTNGPWSEDVSVERGFTWLADQVHG